MLLTDEKFSLTKFFYFFLISLNGGILFGLELVWPTRSWRYEFWSIKIVFSTFLCIYLFVSVSLSLLVGSLSLCFSIENWIALRSTQINFFSLFLLLFNHKTMKRNSYFNENIYYCRTHSVNVLNSVFIYLSAMRVYTLKKIVFLFWLTPATTLKNIRWLVRTKEIYVQCTSYSMFEPETRTRFDRNAMCVWVCVYKYEEKTTNTRA